MLRSSRMCCAVLPTSPCNPDVRQQSRKRRVLWFHAVRGAARGVCVAYYFCVHRSSGRSLGAHWAAARLASATPCTLGGVAE